MIRFTTQNFDLLQGAGRVKGLRQRRHVTGLGAGARVVGHRLHLWRGNDGWFLFFVLHIHGTGRHKRRRRQRRSQWERNISVGKAVLIPQEKAARHEQANSTGHAQFNDRLALFQRHKHPVWLHVFVCLALLPRLATAVSQRAPEPFHRAKLIFVQMPGAAANLRSEQQKRDDETKRGVGLPIKPQPVAVKNEDTDDGLQQIVRQRHTPHVAQRP